MLCPPSLQGNVSQLRANISDLQDSFEGGFQTDVPFVANLMGVELFENCSTTVEAMCTIPLGSMEAGFSICDTSPIDINSNVSIYLFVFVTCVDHM